MTERERLLARAAELEKESDEAFARGLVGKALDLFRMSREAEKAARKTQDQET